MSKTRAQALEKEGDEAAWSPRASLESLPASAPPPTKGDTITPRRPAAATQQPTPSASSPRLPALQPPPSPCMLTSVAASGQAPVGPSGTPWVRAEAHFTATGSFFYPCSHTQESRGWLDLTKLMESKIISVLHGGWESLPSIYLSLLSVATMGKKGHSHNPSPPHPEGAHTKLGGGVALPTCPTLRRV